MKQKRVASDFGRVKDMVSKEKRKQYYKRAYYKDVKKSRDRANSWWAANPDKRFASKIKYRYGLSLEEYQRMYEYQSGVCGICAKDVKLNIDHCHSTGKVRGLLCMDCNHGIGNFRDDPKLLLSAIAYLTSQS